MGGQIAAIGKADQTDASVGLRLLLRIGGDFAHQFRPGRKAVDIVRPTGAEFRHPFRVGGAVMIDHVGVEPAAGELAGVMTEGLDAALCAAPAAAPMQHKRGRVFPPAWRFVELHLHRPLGGGNRHLLACDVGGGGSCGQPGECDKRKNAGQKPFHGLTPL